MPRKPIVAVATRAFLPLSYSRPCRPSVATVAPSSIVDPACWSVAHVTGNGRMQGNRRCFHERSAQCGIRCSSARRRGTSAPLSARVWSDSRFCSATPPRNATASSSCESSQRELMASIPSNTMSAFFAIATILFTHSEPSPSSSSSSSSRSESLASSSPSPSLSSSSSAESSSPSCRRLGVDSDSPSCIMMSSIQSNVPSGQLHSKPLTCRHRMRARPVAR
mmetsp:Transcript_25977/g.90414  ORF Transcript_25977/g.90414 Transcript_25977/m.90414 type:complete len:222 (+) Transcript_25977:959-1624(+)